MQELSGIPTQFFEFLGKRGTFVGKGVGKHTDLQKNIKVHKFVVHKLVNLIFFRYICIKIKCYDYKLRYYSLQLRSFRQSAHQLLPNAECDDGRMGGL